MSTLEDRQMVLALAEDIRKRYGKNSLTATEFADYLGKTPQYVCEKIRRRELPGYFCGRSFSVPVNTIALWENRMSKTRTIT